MYEKFRDPAIKSGTLGGRHYEGDRYRQILYVIRRACLNSYEEKTPKTQHTQIHAHGITVES